MFLAKFGIVGHFSQFGVKGIGKVEKLKELWEIMGKNLQNDQNWPF